MEINTLKSLIEKEFENFDNKNIIPKKSSILEFDKFKSKILFIIDLYESDGSGSSFDLNGNKYTITTKKDNFETYTG